MTLTPDHSLSISLSFTFSSLPIKPSTSFLLRDIGDLMRSMPIRSCVRFVSWAPWPCCQATLFPLLIDKKERMEEFFS